MAEGSQWEAIQLAAHYKLNNLIGVLDVIDWVSARDHARMDLNVYEKRISSFGWKTIAIDGHSIPEILAAYAEALLGTDQPTMLIAKTIKGKASLSLKTKTAGMEKH